MTITLTEQVTRECCQPKDRKPVAGGSYFLGFCNLPTPLFCVHCGRRWTCKGVFSGYVREELP